MQKKKSALHHMNKLHEMYFKINETLEIVITFYNITFYSTSIAFLMQPWRA